jgi:DNA polymerase-3 subunit delta
MLHIFFGPDSFSRREALRELKAELDSDGMLESGTSVFDGRQVTPQEVVAACESAPFFSSHRLVIVEGLLQHVGRGPQGRRSRRRSAPADEGPWQALVDCVDRMPASTTLVLVDGDVPSGGPLLSALSGKGQVRQFRSPQRGALPDWIQRRAQGLGLRIDRRAVSLLVSLVGNDLWTLAAELEKLAAYANGQPVREEDVRALVSAGDIEIWGLLDAIVEGRPSVALKLLRQLFAQGREASYILSMLQRQYRRLGIAREMLDGGATSRTIGQRLGASGYGLEKLLEQAARHPLLGVRRAYRHLLEADVAIKRGIYDEELALELLVQALSAAPARVA